MFKKLFVSFFVLLFLIISGNNTFSYSIPVENVFSDIDNNYKYLHELQTLYDQGMIKPDNEGKFNPRALLNRDEFVGILQEVTCKECIQPNTNINYINQYSGKKVFFDINELNPYFYCVASASDLGYVKGYHIGDKCEDGSFKETEIPFCPNNTIILEEAIAVILRASGILSNEEAEQIRLDIYNGKITEVLSEDVSPKNLDGSVYSFYPDFQKALDYEVLEVDKNGNTKTYFLVEKVYGKIRPKQAISKEMFLRIAYVTLKANSCEDKKKNNLSLKMIIKDKACSESQENCKLSNLQDDSNTYDFTQKVYSTCSEGIENPEGYIWRFFNHETGKEFKKYGRYIDNYKFLQNGKREVFLRVIDNCNNTGEISNTIYVGGIYMNVLIDADPILGFGPLLVDYKGIIGGGKAPFVYKWSFGDGNTGFGQTIKNLFKSEGTYITKLTVTDSRGKTGDASVSIKVKGRKDCNISDSDNDGVSDCFDLCPLITGSIDNKGCPKIDKECVEDSDCENGYECNHNGVCIPIKPDESCEYTGGDVIFGNVVCNKCPCNNFLDFTSTLRRCDIIFPAITSEDNKKIYSRGALYKIK